MFTLSKDILTLTFQHTGAYSSPQYLGCRRLALQTATFARFNALVVDGDLRVQARHAGTATQ
jgi:hypothetical protein